MKLKALLSASILMFGAQSALATKDNKVMAGAACQPTSYLTEFESDDRGISHRNHGLEEFRCAIVKDAYERGSRLYLNAAIERSTTESTFCFLKEVDENGVIMGGQNVEIPPANPSSFDRVQPISMEWTLQDKDGSMTFSCHIPNDAKIVRYHYKEVY